MVGWLAGWLAAETEGSGSGFRSPESPVRCMAGRLLGREGSDGVLSDVRLMAGVVARVTEAAVAHVALLPLHFGHGTCSAQRPPTKLSSMVVHSWQPFCCHAMRDGAKRRRFGATSRFNGAGSRPMSPCVAVAKRQCETASLWGNEPVQLQAAVSRSLCGAVAKRRCKMARRRAPDQKHSSPVFIR